MTFTREINRLMYAMENFGSLVHTQTWQSVDIKDKPEMATHEVRHAFLRVPLTTESLEPYRRDIKPNLPWADDHFEERVCGEPINPGIQWAKWPWGHRAQSFLHEGKFNHNYMERYWPKHAGTLGPTANADEYKARWNANGEDTYSSHGIYHPPGDLDDVVKQIARDPTTRQAILPVFFPEDTGAVHGGRVPCSLAYQFFIRDGKMDITYWLRSCDLRRHLRDDIYLTVRLLLWVLQEVRKINPKLDVVKPGEYVMLITSLHCFRNDFTEMFK